MLDNFERFVTHGALNMNKTSLIIFLGLLISLCTPLTFVKANPGLHVNVPQSPLNPGQPVKIEYYTDPGEDGTIQLDITKPPLLAIFWQSGPMPITGGLLNDITAPGFNDPGTYTVSASVTLSGSGTLYASTNFEVVGVGPGPPPSPGFDFNLEVSPPVLEVGKGDTANYQIHITYGDPSYSGTIINIQVMSLGPGMGWHSTPGGQLSITTSSATPPGSYTFDIIGEAQGVVRQTTATLIVTEGPPPEEPPQEEPPPEQPPEEPPPEEPEELELDSDGDGWSDEDERRIGTDPNKKDTDGDGIWDPQDPNPLVPEKKEAEEEEDSDGDGWTDEDERRIGTDPFNKDTDGDGIWDPQDPNPLVPEKKEAEEEEDIFQKYGLYIALGFGGLILLILLLMLLMRGRREPPVREAPPPTRRKRPPRIVR